MGNAEHGLVTAVAFWNPVCFRGACGMQCVSVCVIEITFLELWQQSLGPFRRYEADVVQSNPLRRADAPQLRSVHDNNPLPHFETFAHAPKAVSCAKETNLTFISILKSLKVTKQIQDILLPL